MKTENLIVKHESQPIKLNPAISPERLGISYEAMAILAKFPDNHFGSPKLKSEI